MGKKSLEIGDFEKTVYLTIKTVFEDSGLTYDQLAKATGVPKATLHDRLSVKRPATLTELEKICKALHLSLSEIVKQAEQS